MTSDYLSDLLHELDSAQGAHAYLSRYATGTQPLAFISPESRKALGNRLSTMAVNVPALAVSSLVERLRVSGFSDPRAWELFVAADLDQLAADAMTDALTYGCGYVLVWSKDGRPTATVERADQCAVLRDPADRTVVAGVKRYETKTDTHAYLYLPDRIEHWRAPRTGAAVSGYVLAETVPHPFGMVPLVPVDNGHSEITDIIPLTDLLVKTLTDMACAGEAAGKPRRWISGLELIERARLDQDGNAVLDVDGQPIIDVVSPIADLNTIQTMVSESVDTKFGQLPGTDLSGFEAGVRIILSQIMAVSALPSHYLGILTSQPSSADALRASEASLTARAEARQLRFGRAWEQVGKLLIAADTGADPADIALRVQWSPADTRSEAQATDAVVKLVQAGILPASWALKRLGYSDDDITLIRAAKRAEALDLQGFGLAGGEQ
ncbi:phage portal protein [Mycolicibacterium sp. BiH015]|uniref:phage portal protein n=1 Tax=Mycolicibacterium sp. BiH015 TaxID=3018808 RepID=UPI0022E7152B|nr:phage portal protein [Mycolicibacterium sp. BiH015]MDA2893061.1 phage portal protein [Mycolicibacterium sp. BiH015]